MQKTNTGRRSFRTTGAPVKQGVYLGDVWAERGGITLSEPAARTERDLRRLFRGREKSIKSARPKVGRTKAEVVHLQRLIIPLAKSFEVTQGPWC